MKHCQIGGRTRQNRPVNILKRDIFTIYSISFEQHFNAYDFFNSEQIVNDFLHVVENKFVVSGNVEVQVAFSVINYQLLKIIFL